MRTVSTKEARQNLRALLDLVQAGEEITILRRGKEVARLVPPLRKNRRLPDLSDFRASLRMLGEPLSKEIVKARREGRY